MPKPRPPKAATSGPKIAPSIASLAVPIGQCKPDPENARTHSARNIEAIAESLREFGQQTPIVVDADGVVRKGNGTLAAATRLGWDRIAAVQTDLSGQRLTAYAIADNRSSDPEIGSEWDDAKLRALLDGLDDDLVFAAGFTDAEIEQTLAGGLVDIEETPAPLPMDAAVSRVGDIWVLGNHRLMCGDSSKPGDLDRLLDGQPIHLVNTDPPYNVKVEPRSNNAIAAGILARKNTHHQLMDLARHPEKAQPTTKKMRAKDRPLANDFVSDDEFDRLLAAWFGNIARVLIPGGGFYIWGGYANCANYPPVLKAMELYFSQAVIWIKEHPHLTRKDFLCNHEWCFYGWKEGAAHRFFGPANVPDTWSVKKVNPQSMVHLTEKPVELAVRAMQYSSQPGENVLDLFGGSGSTLMGAEATGRHAFLMELDAHYCDVIVRRWQAATGREATLAGTETTWAAVAKDRGVSTEEPAADAA